MKNAVELPNQVIGVILTRRTYVFWTGPLAEGDERTRPVATRDVASVRDIPPGVTGFWFFDRLETTLDIGGVEVKVTSEGFLNQSAHIKLGGYDDRSSSLVSLGEDDDEPFDLDTEED